VREVLAEQPPAGQPTARHIALGLFVLAQLAFLCVANFSGMLYERGRRGFPDRFRAPVDQAAPDAKDTRGHVWKLNDAFYALAWNWGQVTGQPQSWSLFAPNVGGECYFPALLIRREEPLDSAAMLARPAHVLAAGAALQAVSVAALLHSQSWTPPEVGLIRRHVGPLLAANPLVAAAVHTLLPPPAQMPVAPHVVLSENEPRDLEHYLRLGKFRLRRLEGGLLPYPSQRDDPESRLAHWRDEIESHVRRYGSLIETYCRFRLTTDARYRDRPLPAQVILVMRLYRIRPPEDPSPRRWTGPETLPIARWRPHHPGDANTRPVDWYNPQTERFETIGK